MVDEAPVGRVDGASTTVSVADARSDRRASAYNARGHMEERHIELVWRCSSCRVQNLGRHVACTGCGNPKDDSEEYEMPGDPSAVASVTDASLLALATGGENWRCRYCQSHQRRHDGACAACGAGSDEGGAVADGPRVHPSFASSPSTASAGEGTSSSGRRPRPALIGIGVVVALVMGLGIVGLVGRSKAPVPPVQRTLTTHVRVVDGAVTGRSWEHRVLVDRWKKVPHEGFAELRPTDAVDVVPLGQREHHKERVPNGYKTETYSERVSDGSTTETYTATESCGQTCTQRPKSCRQVCSSSKNGFAKCREECTGGGQSCTTKTCSVTKTRSVPRYKDVTRTRQIPQFRDEPRFAPFFSWKLWQWVEDRRIARKGTSDPPSWPEPTELTPKDKLGEGERERDRRDSTYAIVVSAHDQSPLDVRLEDLPAFERASKATSVPVWLTPNGDAGILALPTQ